MRPPPPSQRKSEGVSQQTATRQGMPPTWNAMTQEPGPRLLSQLQVNPPQDEAARAMCLAKGGARLTVFSPLTWACKETSSVGSIHEAASLPAVMQASLLGRTPTTSTPAQGNGLEALAGGGGQHERGAWDTRQRDTACLLLGRATMYTLLDNTGREGETRHGQSAD